MSEKYVFIENFDVPKNYMFFEKKSQHFSISNFLKIDFRHEKFIFFFQIFFSSKDMLILFDSRTSRSAKNKVN